MQYSQNPGNTRYSSREEIQLSCCQCMNNREDCLKRLLRRHLLFFLCSIFVIGMVAGCKTTGTTTVPTATKSAVQITLQNVRLDVSEPLGILVTNTGSTDLHAIDGKAACTFLQLQQYDSEKKSWVSRDQCRNAASSHVLTIRAHMSEAFTLAPSSASNPNSWEPGVYRIALSFSTNRDGTSGAQVTYSQGFTIQRS